MATNYLNKFNSTTSGNSKKGRPIKRMEFTFKNQSFKFALNPEEYSQSEPIRATLTQTKGGAWIDTFGKGIIEISISGTTGVRGSSGTNIDVGYQRFKSLRNLMRSVYENISDGSTVTDLIGFYNYTDNEYYWCFPKQNGIELTRSKSRPNVYQYSINLYALRRIGEAETTSTIIGNPNRAAVSNSGSSKSKTTVSRYAASSVTDSVVSYNPYTYSEVMPSNETVVRTKINTAIIRDAAIVTDMMEPIIGGKHGKVHPATAWQCISGISIQSQGTVQNLPVLKLSDVTEKSGLMYDNVEVKPKVSVDTYNMVQAMKVYSTDYLSTEWSAITGGTDETRIIATISANTDYSSTLFENALSFRKKGTISKSNYNRIKMLILESMHFYIEIYKISSLDDTDSQISSVITQTQASNLISNLNAMILCLRYGSSDDDLLYNVDLMSDLRTLEKAITQLNSDVLKYI